MFSAVTVPWILAVRTYEPEISTVEIPSQDEMVTDDDVTSNLASEGNPPLIVMVTVPPSTSSKRKWPPPAVVVESPVLRVTTTPSTPTPSIEIRPMMVHTGGESAIWSHARTWTPSRKSAASSLCLFMSPYT